MNGKAKGSSRFAASVRELPPQLRHGEAGKVYRAAIAARKAVAQAELVLANATKAASEMAARVTQAEQELEGARGLLVAAEAALPAEE